jgi:ATP-dependent DNA helicase RecQ
LFNNLPVKLISPQEIKRKTEQQLQKEPLKTGKDNEDLFEELKNLRKEIATVENIAAYMVFNDATLSQIAKEKPITEIHLKRISGVGEKKFALYGERIINTVIDFCKSQGQEAHEKISTYQQTFTEYQKGFTVPEISLSRGLSEATIISHLIYLYENDYEIDLYKFVSLKDLNKVFNAIKKLDYQYRLKDIFEHLNGEVDYNSIKFSVAHFKKKK